MDLDEFKTIKPTEINDNAIKLIGSDWMLITAGNKESYNTMTASWGFLGFMWNKPCAVCFIRPTRYTFDFIEKSENFTLSFFDAEKYRKMLSFCGSKSGRDTDKIKECGITPLEMKNGAVSFKESKLILNCKKLYTQDLAEEGFLNKAIFEAAYSKEKLHKMYISEITEVLIK